MNSTPITNVIDFPTREQNAEIELAHEEPSANYGEDLQLWSALTLGALQKQLTGHEDDHRFSAARELVDALAQKFATADPIEIADYFEAVAAIGALKNDSSSLDELEAIDHLAA